MGSSKNVHKIAGWLVFAIALTVYYFSAERTGSLWDCGEFILGAYKLQVVHPPGAPFFVLVGRLFTWVAELVSDDPAYIAFAVNLMSGICTAFAAMFICWVTIILGRFTLVGREEELDTGQTIALTGAGLVAGLATAFTTSVWFSAVEGEVYAMSTFFTTLTLWSMMKWYSLPDEPQHDRWLVFTVFIAGLSIGVHLLSLLTFPALAMFYYFKKYNHHSFWGIVAAAGVGVGFIVVIQSLIIVGIPQLWATYELLMVNGLGLPFHSGLIPTLLVVGSIFVIGLMYLHEKLRSPVALYVLAGIILVTAIYGASNDGGRFWWRILGAAILIGSAWFMKTIVENRRDAQVLLVSLGLVVVGFSTIGVVVIRANVDPPINMNAPSDAFRLIPYLNREQYGERALLRGPHFGAQPINTETSDRYGRVGDRYEITDHKVSLVYEERDKMLFPRMGDATQNREGLYKQWMGLNPNQPLPPGRPNQLDNISFLARYQLGWMYWRYFMWNFSGRQNGEQGFYPWDYSSGNWITGIKFIDAMRLGNQSELPQTELDNKARNTYFALPFLFGLFGLFFQFGRRNNEALGLMVLFIITGIGIIIYSNQPPNEPRERDYVLVGSFFTYCIWIGMGVLAIFQMMRSRMQLGGVPAAAIASLLVLTAPTLMGFENFDDHSRRLHSGARDYASNFLESCEPNAIIFTYGDNDTYPLWYAQEVEGIRTDVRVVNLSLIAVDWYINLLRRKVNDSPPIKMTVPEEAYRGKKRNQVFYFNQSGRPDREMPLTDWLQFIGEYHPLRAGSREIESHFPSKKVFLPVDKEAILKQGVVGVEDTASIVSKIPVTLRGESLIKDELAILDVIGSNLWERPVYFAVTCRPEKLFGMADYLQLEGLGLRIVPVKSDSDPNYGIIGSGRVNADAVYENVMNKWRWGGFDTYDLYVERSYMPSVQSMQLSMRRAAFALLRSGDKERAVDLIDKYFEAFPHMNFPYDYRTMYMLGVYFQADAYDKAKPHLEILARETVDYLDFYSSLSEADLAQGYETPYQLSLRTMLDIKREAQRANDTEFLEELATLFAPYELAEEAPAGFSD